MGEKKTDQLMLNVWESVFGCSYETEGGSGLFGTLRPDGWYEYESLTGSYLFIIENKQSAKFEKDAKEQIRNYYKQLQQINPTRTYKNIFLIIGLGKTKTTFEYKIYQIQGTELVKCDYSLEHIKEIMDYKTEFNESVIHEFNQYMWDNGINLPKSQKTLFIAGILLALKIDPKLINDYQPDKPGFIIANKIIELIECEYNDPPFTSQFKFIQKSLHNKHLFELVTKIKNTVSNYGVDVLNKFYSEFCKYDKNNDSQLGVVLTPQDIVSLMISELQIKEDHSVLDFCTGTGSFLLESSKFTKNLIGCENNEERYALCKCNFILNGLDYSKLYFNSCFAQKFDKYDRSIINPPFSTNSSDINLVENNETHWKEFNKEQKFLLYQVQHLKIGGIGACIIPRSNFNNTVKKTLNFKAELMRHIVINKIINLNSRVFVPVANVECAIIIYTRTQSTDSPQTSPNVTIVDYTNDGYQIKKKIRTKCNDSIIQTQIRTLSYTDDFNYQSDIDINDSFKQLLINHFDNQYINVNKIINNIVKNIDIKNTKIIKLLDILEPIKLKSYTISKVGIYPLYGATKINKESGKAIDYSIDTLESDDISIKLNGICCINKTGNGGAGYVHIHKGKFAITSSVLPCKIKTRLSDLNYSFISVQLHKIFNRFNSFTLDKLDTEVKIIVNESLIKIPKIYVKIDDEYLSLDSF